MIIIPLWRAVIIISRHYNASLTSIRVTTNVLLWRLSTMFEYASTKDLVKLIPWLEFHVPILDSPSLFTSTTSSSKSVLNPWLSNLITPVRPLISTCDNEKKIFKKKALWSTIRLDRYYFHVIYQAVAVRPCIGSVAAQRFYVDLLATVQIVECPGEQMDGVVNQSGFRLNRQTLHRYRGKYRVDTLCCNDKNAVVLTDMTVKFSPCNDNKKN